MRIKETAEQAGESDKERVIITRGYEGCKPPEIRCGKWLSQTRTYSVPHTEDKNDKQSSCSRKNYETIQNELTEMSRLTRSARGEKQYKITSLLGVEVNYELR